MKRRRRSKMDFAALNSAGTTEDVPAPAPSPKRKAKKAPAKKAIAKVRPAATAALRARLRRWLFGWFGCDR